VSLFLIGDARGLGFSTPVGSNIDIATLLNIELWDLVLGSLR
jgi:hypothetical protein